MIRINVKQDALHLHGTMRPLASVLETARRVDGPVIVMTHGFKYRPGHPQSCPHRHILSMEPEALPWLAPSWPRELGFGTVEGDGGLAIALGWDGRGALWQARSRAVRAGQALARLVEGLHRMRPDRPIHFIGHSMGVELALEALHLLPPGALRRIISVSGAVYCGRAQEALHTPAGQAVEFINVTSRENDLFDWLYERVVAPPRPSDRTIGAGLDLANAVTLQLDCSDTLHHLARLGLPVSPPQHRVCHWSGYMRPGALNLYRHLLRQPQHLTLELLRHGLPAQPAPRWSRIRAWSPARTDLPFAPNAS
ncbi:alpha/beta hydrolase [Ruegeria marina]|uniref:Alpha/beta hydrolase family protein n=1 Tax=Ruegeria marina TaxID=639004 RepID=A0A1G6KPK4_9RHOB|nr:alpha/beta hydrolase [Ruegeria marina]SDC32465.1 Alpha/beta hydrolase of unknown function [Ruegeria marina]